MTDGADGNDSQGPTARQAPWRSMGMILETRATFPARLPEPNAILARLDPEMGSALFGAGVGDVRNAEKR